MIYLSQIVYPSCEGFLIVTSSSWGSGPHSLSRSLSSESGDPRNRSSLGNNLSSLSSISRSPRGLGGFLGNLSSPNNRTNPNSLSRGAGSISRGPGSVSRSPHGLEGLVRSVSNRTNPNGFSRGPRGLGNVSRGLCGLGSLSCGPCGLRSLSRCPGSLSCGPGSLRRGQCSLGSPIGSLADSGSIGRNSLGSTPSGPGCVLSVLSGLGRRSSVTQTTMQITDTHLARCEPERLETVSGGPDPGEH